MPTGANRPRQHSPRKSSRERGYGYKWQKYSKRRLAANPFCESDHCRDHYTVATCTDHIQPVTGADDPLFWQPSNHQSLCHSCHSRKTATETNGQAIR